MNQDDSTHATVGRFENLASKDVRYFAPGIALRSTRAVGLQMIHVTFDPHAEAPVHAHPEEQVVLVLDGGMSFQLDGVVRDLVAGDIVIVPPNVPHGATAGPQGCVEVECFNPPRPPFPDE